MPESDEITRKAKSNLAFALMDLPEEKRRRMAQFYAFCRIVDDIVDEPGLGAEERHAALDRWVQVISRRCTPCAGIEEEVQGLVKTLRMDIEPMLQLIEGCRSDIAQSQPATRHDLLAYTYRVASCVGISSAAVMGASERSRGYAVAMGHALQLVNIIRDVAEDAEKYSRVYLPADDMELFGVKKEDLYNRRYSFRLRHLLAYESALAEKFFSEADDLYAGLDRDDRNALIPAQAMSLIYHTILEGMRNDEFRVFEKRYSINNVRKLWFLLRARIDTVEMPSIPSFPSLSDWGIFKAKDSVSKE